MPRWLVIVLAVAGLVAAAVVEGTRSNRWGTSDDVRAAAAKLGRVPAAFGDWTGEDVPMDDKVLKVAEAAGYVQRVYTNRTDKTRVTVLILCGPSGPIGAHTPEVCYAGNGFEMSGEARRQTVAPPGLPAATYWSARFDKKGQSDGLRVCWMWGVGGDWEASANPRLGLHAVLYKMYVVHSESGSPPAARDPVHEFLMDFVPEVKKALTAP